MTLVRSTPAILLATILLGIVVASTSMTVALAQEPAVEAPAAEAPAGETPAGEVPAAETPATETPAAEEKPAEAKADDHDHDHEHGDEHAAEHGDDHGDHDDHGAAMARNMPIWAIIPFALLLLSIAVFPLVNHHWWDDNMNKAKVVAILSIPMALYLFIVWSSPGLHELEHKGKEYISFMMLLGALYVISGGILVKGSLDGTPIFNTFVLLLGALIASFIGTTGASVLLIRPLLRANAPRVKKAHIVIFFIFIVSNCGGLLTPLGDPPLFLGYLAGVPFTWTFQLWNEWLIVNGILLVIFHIWDQMVFNKEELQRPGSQLEEVQKHEPLAILGLHNFVFLAVVVGVIYSAGAGLGNGGKPWPWGIQELAMLVAAGVSYFMTAPKFREANKFTFHPIIEVAVLFIGIFITMIPALLVLNANGSKLGLSEPWHFFWATGLLSSFLDNAPTYLTFAATACGMENIKLEGAYMAEFIKAGPAAVDTLAAISCGAVFMGANTYIGNGPNFMVKAIAEENGVKMPTFFGYMAYSGLILIPVFIIVTFISFM